MQIVAECFAERELALMSEFNSGVIVKKSGINQVVSYLKDRYSSSDARPIVGLIDNDKPGKFDSQFITTRFKIVDERHGILHRQIEGRELHLLILNPDFENWLYQCCVTHGIRVKDDRQQFLKTVKGQKRLPDYSYVKEFLLRLKSVNGGPISYYKDKLHSLLGTP